MSEIFVRLFWWEFITFGSTIFFRLLGSFEGWFKLFLLNALPSFPSFPSSSVSGRIFFLKGNLGFSSELSSSNNSKIPFLFVGVLKEISDGIFFSCFLDKKGFSETFKVSL